MAKACGFIIHYLGKPQKMLDEEEEKCTSALYFTFKQQNNFPIYSCRESCMVL